MLGVGIHTTQHQLINFCYPQRNHLDMIRYLFSQMPFDCFQTIFKMDYYHHYLIFVLVSFINSLLVKSINVEYKIHSKTELVQARENLTFRLTVFYDESQAIGENCQLFILGINNYKIKILLRQLFVYNFV